MVRWREARRGPLPPHPLERLAARRLLERRGVSRERLAPRPDARGGTAGGRRAAVGAVELAEPCVRPRPVRLSIERRRAARAAARHCRRRRRTRLKDGGPATAGGGGSGSSNRRGAPTAERHLVGRRAGKRVFVITIARTVGSGTTTAATPPAVARGARSSVL